MTITKKFSEICSGQSPNFINWFGDMEYSKDKPKKLYGTKLPRPMNDTEIMAKLNWSEVLLADIFNHLKTASHDDWMIFYVRDIPGVLRAVCVDWGGVGWLVHAREVTLPSRWHDGCQVFSRNSVLKSSDTSVALSPSDTLTLPETLVVNGITYKKQ